MTDATVEQAVLHALALNPGGLTRDELLDVLGVNRIDDLERRFRAATGVVEALTALERRAAAVHEYGNWRLPDPDA